MTLCEFNLLESRLKKYDAAFTKSEFINVIVQNNRKYVLYTIDKFFVEITYDPTSNKILEYKAFKSGDILHKHADAIRLSKN